MAQSQVHTGPNRGAAFFCPGAFFCLPCIFHGLLRANLNLMVLLKPTEQILKEVPCL